MHQMLGPKHMVFPLILLLLFTNVLPLIPMELGGGEQIVVDKQGGDYSSIQAAVYDASDGDSILVKDGTYHENVELDKSLDIRGESRELTVINGSGDDPALEMLADGCTVANFTVEDSPVGIQVRGNDSRVEHCDMLDNHRGVVFYGSTDAAVNDTDMEGGGTGILFWNDIKSSVENVSIKNTNERGLRFVGSASSSVRNSTVRSADYHGAYISSSADISIRNSTMENNSRGLLIYDSRKVVLVDDHLSSGIAIQGPLTRWHTHTIQNTTVHNGTLRFMKNSTGQRIADHSGQLIMLNCSHSTVIGGTMEQLEAGLVLAGSSNNTIIGGTMRDNRDGIEMYDSRDNSLHHNNLENNIHQVYSNDSSPENNTWHDGRGVGNYWDDYEGLDDGTDGRYKNDGVGDTALKHPSTDHGGGYHQLDPYPLMNSTKRIERTIGLNASGRGWNLISTGLTNDLDTVSELMAENNVSTDKLMTYSAEENRWKTRVEGRAEKFNDAIPDHRNSAFWIRVDTSKNISVTGFSSPRTLTDIHPGWNLLAPAVGTNLSGTELPPEIDRVATFNASREYMLEYGTPGDITLEAEEGYWMHSTAGSTITWNQVWE